SRFVHRRDLLWVAQPFAAAVEAELCTPGIQMKEVEFNVTYSKLIVPNVMASTTYCKNLKDRKDFCVVREVGLFNAVMLKQSRKNARKVLPSRDAFISFVVNNATTSAGSLLSGIASFFGFGAKQKACTAE